MFYKEFSDNRVFAICYRFKTCLTYKIYYIFRCNIALKILHEILMHDIKIFTMFPVNSQGCSFLPLCRCHFMSVFFKKKTLTFYLCSLLFKFGVQIVFNIPYFVTHSNKSFPAYWHVLMYLITTPLKRFKNSMRIYDIIFILIFLMDIVLYS